MALVVFAAYSVVVAIEIEVRAHEEVIHRVNGKEVLRYQRPQLDPEGRDVITILQGIKRAGALHAELIVQ